MSATVTMKVVLLGNSGVGKTSISWRFANDTFEEERQPTIGAAYLTRTMTIGDERVKFNIWDTAGQERYRAMAKMYYQDAHAAILVYDITSKESFRELKLWYKELRDYGLPNIAIAVAANKFDLVEKRAVEEAEGVTWAREIGASFTNTSPLRNLGIEKLFTELVRHSSMQSFETGGVKVRRDKSKAESGCHC